MGKPPYFNKKKFKNEKLHKSIHILDVELENWGNWRGTRGEKFPRQKDGIHEDLRDEDGIDKDPWHKDGIHKDPRQKYGIHKNLRHKDNNWWNIVIRVGKIIG